MKRIETQNTGPATADGDFAAVDIAAVVPAPECRALTVVGPSRTAPDEIARPHNSAAFVTQLLAAKASLPQTRERRRAEPDVAMHSYELGMMTPPPAQGRLVSRAM